MRSCFAITAAMPEGTGLAEFSKSFPKKILRCGDSGTTCRNLCRRSCHRRIQAGSDNIFHLSSEGPLIRLSMTFASPICRLFLPLGPWGGSWVTTGLHITGISILTYLRSLPQYDPHGAKG